MANNIMNVYLTTRTHYGHVGEAVRMIYGKYSKNKLIAVRNSKASHLNHVQAVLDAIRYLYSCGFIKYSIRLISNQPSLIRVVNHLKAWQIQGWPVSFYTSRELFLNAKDRKLARISLKYIPRNYVKDILLYQRILRGFAFFPVVTVHYCYQNNNNMAMLNAFTWNQIKDLDPTTYFLNHSQIRDARILSNQPSVMNQILNNTSLQNRFKSICDSSAKSPLHVIRNLVIGYIKSNGGSGKQYNWKHDLYHRVIRCAKIAFSWNDMLKKLNSYGIHANVFNNKYLKTGTGAPFLNDIHYSFIDKRGHHINAYGKDLNHKLTIKALTKLITKNTEHQLAHQN